MSTKQPPLKQGMRISIVNPSETKAILKKFNIRLTKKLGQHFLVDANIIAKEITAAGLTEADTVLEIGPGIGALTEALAGKAGRVIAIEVDKRFMSIVEETLAGQPNVTIIRADALDLKLGSFGANKLISNLPYNVATPLIVKVLTEAPEITEATVMVQKEVARRMTAPPGDDDYGPLAITIDAYAAARILFSVSPRSFLPPPEVESAVVAIKRRLQPLYGDDTTAFLLFVRELFTFRRKTVRSALKTRQSALVSQIAETVIAEAGLTSESRVEKLTPAELFNVFAAQKRFLS